MGFRCQEVTEMPIDLEEGKRDNISFFGCQAWKNERLYFIVKILVIEEGKEAYKDFIRNV